MRPKTIGVQPANDKYSAFYVFRSDGSVVRWTPTDKSGTDLEHVGWTVFEDEIDPPDEPEDDDADGDAEGEDPDDE